MITHKSMPCRDITNEVTTYIESEELPQPPHPLTKRSQSVVGLGKCLAGQRARGVWPWLRRAGLEDVTQHAPCLPGQAGMFQEVLLLRD